MALSSLFSSLLILALCSLSLARPFEATTLEKLRERGSLPASPNGAQLIQLTSCYGVSATVPMFVNNQYEKSNLRSAYIVQHGSNRNFNDYFTAVYNIIGTGGIIAAPNNYVSSDSGEWYQPSINLAWSPDDNTWSVGADAVAPTSGSKALNGAQCSSYDTYDAILNHLDNKSLFPNLEKVYFVSHSGGSSMVSRYSQIYNGHHSFSIRYILANAATHAYFTNARPTDDSCSDLHQYPYQLVTTGMNRYVAARFTNAVAIFQRWMSRDVVSLIGDLDTAARYPGGTESCSAMAEGGTDRRDRNYAWWAYQNILANTGASVSSYTGYHHLIKNGAKSISNGASFNHQNCVIAGVGHDETPMFDSDCGRAAMTKSTIPAGVGAQYP